MPRPPAGSASPPSPAGPGLTQVGTSLVVAARGHSPIVLIVGEIPPGAKNSLQSMDQRKFAEACGARFHSITSVDNAADEIAEAFYAARVHRGPVVLNLPIDLQEKSFDWDWDYRPSHRVLPPLLEAPSEAALAPVADKLAAAERPVIIAGRGARAAKAAIVRLAERTGALLATSLQAQGPVQRRGLRHRHLRRLRLPPRRGTAGGGRLRPRGGRRAWLLHQ